MLFAIKNFNDNTIDESTVAYSPEEAWDKDLGHSYVDDQWAWKRQKAESRGFFAVEVGLVQVPNVVIDEHIRLAREWNSET